MRISLRFLYRQSYSARLRTLLYDKYGKIMEEDFVLDCNYVAEQQAAWNMEDDPSCCP